MTSELKTSASAQELAAVINHHRFLYQDEYQLQDGIEAALRGAGYEPVREVRLSAADRVDIMVGSVAIEVKIAGRAPSVIRQLMRYAKHDEVSELILVTTKIRHNEVPPFLDGKPVHIVYALAGL